MFSQFLPLIELSVFIAVGVFWRGWLQYQRYGHSGIALFRANDFRHRARDSFFCLLFGAIVVQAAVFAYEPAWLAATMIVSPPAWIVVPGSVLLFGGLLLLVAAQLGMGASWRIGIDPTAKPGLVTAGLYQFCRNPIYLGLLASLLGLSILLPTWLSVAFFAGVVWCIRTQVFEEEAYLRKTYGREFEAYAARVGRFIPRFGRLCLEATR